METHSHEFQSGEMAIPQLDGPVDHPYPTRYATATDKSYGPMQATTSSPTKGNKKIVTFELQFEGAPEIRGRLPLRVGISPHDTTESIISVVKNFYGIYDHTIQGISFEDKESGSMMIPRFENFEQDMHVAVRIVPGVAPSVGPQQAWTPDPSAPVESPAPDANMPVAPALSAHILHQPPSRPSSRVAARKQSASPQLGSISGASKGRSRSAAGKPSKASFQEGLDELDDAHNGYSSGDGGPGSVSSSRLGATADISVENILEGGRRHYAKFDSSELPLFVPPQVPAPNSISSISPQRRSNGFENPSPFERPTQKNFSYNLPLPSPQSYTFDQPQSGSPANGGFQVPAVPKHGRSLRDRTSGASVATNRSSLGASGVRRNANGVLPTPDPTVASTISDEDVALQLMRLSDMSNFSHGRTSASAMDDAFSGRAEAASSASDDEAADEQPLPFLHPSTEFAKGKRKHNHVHELPSYDSIEHTGDEADGDYDAGAVKNEYDGEDGLPRAKFPKNKATVRSRMGMGIAKPRSSKPPGKIRTGSTSTVNTAVAGSIGRKPSSASTLTFAHQPGADEDDLSTKPRCQRCRKSKKGCDRQRPCGRCRDAGIGIEGCISEDEGNGRKGRYGRHMGVPVKKAHLVGNVGTSGSPTTSEGGQTPHSHVFEADIKSVGTTPEDSQDASKKRKRV